MYTQTALHGCFCRFSAYTKSAWSPDMSVVDEIMPTNKWSKQLWYHKLCHPTKRTFWNFMTSFIWQGTRLYYCRKLWDLKSPIEPCKVAVGFWAAYIHFQQEECNNAGCTENQSTITVLVWYCNFLRVQNLYYYLHMRFLCVPYI